MKIFKKKLDWDGRERRSAERIQLVMLKNLAMKFRLSRLRKRLLIYFFLVIFVSLSVGLQLIYEVGSSRLQKKISDDIRQKYLSAEAGAPDMSGIEKILQRLQYRMILITFIVSLCVVATMFVFIKNIVTPLDAMGRAAKRIADGHLDETVPVNSDDEIGKIGDLINDLATNLQEILLHIWNHTGQDIILLDHISEVVKSDSMNEMSQQVKDEIEFVRQDVGDMMDLVKDFDFYNIQIEDGKVMATKNSNGVGTQ